MLGKALRGCCLFAGLVDLFVFWLLFVCGPIALFVKFALLCFV